MAVDLLADLYAITNRPDLVDLSKTALWMATSELHKLDFFKKDIVEQYISVSDTTSAGTGHPLQLALPINFRRWKYIRPRLIDGSYGQPLVQQEASDIFNVVDHGRGCTLATEVYYNAGLNCNIYTAKQVQGFLLGYYSVPLRITDWYLTDWLCQQHSETVTEMAAAKLFAIVENEAMAQIHLRFVEPLKRQIIVQETLETEE